MAVSLINFYNNQSINQNLQEVPSKHEIQSEKGIIFHLSLVGIPINLVIC